MSDGGGKHIDTGPVRSTNQTWTADAPLPLSAHFTWRVLLLLPPGDHSSAAAGQAPMEVPWSRNHSFFTPVAWAAPTSTPIWARAAKAAGSSSTPKYVFLKSQLPAPAAMAVERPVSAVVYITANAPLDNSSSTGEREPWRPSTILAAYKLWVGGRMIGMGPGRGRCGPDPGGCVGEDAEQPYDGYDITALVADAGGEIFIAAYGVPGLGGMPKAQAQIVVGRADGSSAVYGTGARSSAFGGGLEWPGFDADAVYNPQGDSGCAWYFCKDHRERCSSGNISLGDPLALLPWHLQTYSAHHCPSTPERTVWRTRLRSLADPEEWYDASNMIAGTPLSPRITAQRDTAGRWSTVIAQARFSNALTPKPTAPISVTERPAVELIETGKGLWFFDMGRNLQGGVVLTVQLPETLALAPAAHRTVVITVAEELTANSSKTIMFPPRTGIHPQMEWTLAATTEPQTLAHHEYLVFRYGSLQFGGHTTGNGSQCGDHAPLNAPASIACPDTSVITGFSFASFGTPIGACYTSSKGPYAAFAASAACGSQNTMTTLAKLCVGKTNCTVDVNSNAVWPSPFY